MNEILLTSEHDRRLLCLHVWNCCCVRWCLSDAESPRQRRRFEGRHKRIVGLLARYSTSPAKECKTKRFPYLLGGHGESGRVSQEKKGRRHLQVDEERPQIFLQAHCTLNVGASLFVVKLAVVYHEHKVSVQHLLGLVVISLTNSFFDSRQIDRFLDYLKVVL